MVVDQITISNRTKEKAVNLKKTFPNLELINLGETIKSELIIKATKVNGIYDSDPNLDKKAKLIRDITYTEVISKNLRVMDLTAISLAKESSIPIYITNIFKEDSLIRALKDELDAENHIDFQGVGGPLMELEGFKSLFSFSILSVMGIRDIVFNMQITTK